MDVGQRRAKTTGVTGAFLIVLADVVVGSGGPEQKFRNVPISAT
jgi:hypothetical protein